jgi:leader peptidase (prepilin peptidase) / N-methyltransferase
MLTTMFDAHIWAAVPFAFWAVVAFFLGSIVGSFLNVCIYRLPLGQSIVWPPSHCPHCQYAIPWYLNVPLFTWLYLRGRCRNCGAPISARYFAVELLTALVFLLCCFRFGHQSMWLALVYAIFLSGLITATFIDFEHFIIPDEITIGGTAAGFLVSFLLPAVQGEHTHGAALKQSVLGILVGAGLIYAILRAGKLLFGRQRIALPEQARIIFTESSILLPDKEIPYEELFYRASDVIALEAETVEMVDRCYKDVQLRLTPTSLRVGEDIFDPEKVPQLEATSAEIVLPREAMGLGDVKFMAAIGAFLGWKAVLFSLMVSSIIGSVVGITLIALRKESWSSRLPYGPYIAAAAALWIFGGKHLVDWWFVPERYMGP